MQTLPKAAAAVVTAVPPNWNIPVPACVEPVVCPVWNGVLPAVAAVDPALNENGEADAEVFGNPKLNAAAAFPVEVPNGV
jgi:hypothetical protein